jgi:hypothetical protein
MAIIANSTISENPIGVESIASPASDLKLEAFSAVSRTFIVDDTAVLILSNGVDEVIAPFNVTDPTELLISADDNVTILLKSTDVGSLSLSDEETISSTFKFDDTVSLTLVGFEKPDDDVASEAWRPFPGLPIQPIGYSPIASEQFDINFRSFSEINTVEVEIAAEDSVEIILNSVEVIDLEINDQAITSSTHAYVDQGNIGIFSFDSKEIYLNSDETGSLEIAAEDSVEQIFSFIEVGNLSISTEVLNSAALNSVEEFNLETTAEVTTSTALNYYETGVTVITADATQQNISNVVDSTQPSLVVGFDQTSISYFSYEDAVALITAKDFSKEYTFLQQITSIDLIQLKLDIQSSEVYSENRSGIVRRSRQIWIG